MLFLLVHLDTGVQAVEAAEKYFCFWQKYCIQLPKWSIIQRGRKLLGRRKVWKYKWNFSLGFVGDTWLDYTWYFQALVFTESQQLLLQPHASIKLAGYTLLSTEIFVIVDHYAFIWLGVLALTGMKSSMVLAICQQKVSTSTASWYKVLVWINANHCTQSCSRLAACTQVSVAFSYL